MRNIVAILRGITPEDAEAVGQAVFAAGLTIIEVPLNSPEPFASIHKLVGSLGRKALIGAGTVITESEVEQVAAIGGQLVVSPNTDSAVIARTLALGMQSMPGVFTASDCFAALKAGARTLKLFPACIARPDGLKALKAVLPTDVEIWTVGGAGPEDFCNWWTAGASGFGIGSALYRPGDSAETVAARAQQIVTAYDALVG